MQVYVHMYIYKGTCVYIHIKVLLIFICMCVYVPHVCSCPQKSEKASDTQDLGLQVVVSHLSWVLGTNSNSLEEQQVLLITEPSLLPRLIGSF